jgi:hypothetical protein
VNDERIVEYLGSRGLAELPPDFSASVMAAVDRAPMQRSRFSPYLPAFVAVGAVALVAVLAVLLGQARNVGPGPDASPPPSATAAGETVDQLRAAVTDATQRLADTGAVQGTQMTWIEEYLASATWFDWRSNGDQVVVTRSDIDVQAPWWLDPEGEPLSFGERIQTEMHVLAGDSWYRAEDGSWLIEDRTAAPRGPLAYGIGLLTGSIPPVPPGMDVAGSVVTRRGAANGDEIWTLEGGEGDQAGHAEWRFGPDGVLVSFAAEGVQSLAPSENLGSASTRSVIDFTPLGDVEPLAAPEGAPPDPAEYGLPDDFPLD